MDQMQHGIFSTRVVQFYRCNNNIEGGKQDHGLKTGAKTKSIFIKYIY